MSYRDALKVFKLERELTSDETAFLNTLRSMTDAERELTVAALSPEPVKRAGKKAAKGAGKSRRAASLGQQMSSAIKLPIVNGPPNPGDGLCVVRIGGKGERCGEPADANVHHLTTHPDYHEFKAWEVTAIAPALTAKDDNYEEQMVGVGGEG